MTMLPAKFVERVLRELGPDEGGALCRALTGEPSVSVRLNAAKGLAAPSGRPIGWSSGGYWLDARPSFTLDPDFHAGRYYVQEASSQFVGHIVAACGGIRGGRVLDLCAAPGGKTTLYSTLAGRGGLVVANEIVRNRAAVLADNVRKWGVGNVAVTVNDPSQVARLEGWFDAVAVDAPCSGEGMFRKNAREALGEWSEENVRLCAVRQSEILSEATKLLRPGGRLVYSTCTFSVEEDEGQVSDYLKNHSEMRLLKSEKFYPHKIAGEGHFAALFEKADGAERTAPRPLRPRVSKEAERLYRAFEREFFLSPFAETLHEAGGLLYALPEDTFDFSLLRVLRAGVRLGEVKNGRFEPSHSLAMCAERAECRNVLELCLSDVRVGRFLRGESVETDEKLKNGFCLVCVGGYPVGYGKAVNGTVKNHIPKALRRMSA